MEEKLLTPEEAAEYLAVSPKTIRKWLRGEKIKGVKIGKLWRIRKKDLDALLEEEGVENEHGKGKNADS
jgi:excisionase family DNA binding protein